MMGDVVGTTAAAAEAMVDEVEEGDEEGRGVPVVIVDGVVVVAEEVVVVEEEDAPGLRLPGRRPVIVVVIEDDLPHQVVDVVVVLPVPRRGPRRVAVVGMAAIRHMLHMTIACEACLTVWTAAGHTITNNLHFQETLLGLLPHFLNIFLMVGGMVVLGVVVAVMPPPQLRPRTRNA
jgi:hypothetical protein